MRLKSYQRYIMYIKDICNLYTDLLISGKKYVVLICLCVISNETSIIANPIQSNVAGREKWGFFWHVISLLKNKRKKYIKRPTGLKVT